MNDPIIYKSVKELKPHPLNEKYFDKMKGEQWEILLNSIKTKGIFHTLVITEDGTVLSGHQRWLAAKKLKIEKVPCRVLKGIDPNSPEAEAVILEANMAQRIITPETYRKCWEGYEKISVSKENLKEKLIPEFQEALTSGDLQIQIARALAKFTPKEQKEFLALIKIKIENAYHTKIEVLTKTLNEKKKEISEITKKIKVKEDEIKKLNDKIQKNKAKQEKILAEKEKIENERKKYLDKINALNTEIENLRRNPPPQIQKKITEKEREIEKYRKKIEQKDSEIKYWKEQYDTVKENSDILYKELQKERKAKEKMKRNFEKEMKDELQKAQKQHEEELEKIKKQYFAPPSQRYSALLDFMSEILEEITGYIEGLKSDQKEELLLKKLELIREQIQVAIDMFLKRTINYSYEEKIQNLPSSNNTEIPFSELEDEDSEEL